MKLTSSLSVLLASVTACSVLAVAPVAAQEAPPSASPTPTGSPRPGCGAPSFQSINVEPVAVAAGDTVTVTVLVRDEPCYADESSPHELQLFAAREPNKDPAPLIRGTTDSAGRFVYTERATASTVYYLTTLDGRQRGGNSSAAVRVDRTSGSCARAITLSGPMPSVAGTGEQVMVHGNSSDTSTVSILFRKRGQSAFMVRRRVEPAGSQGTFVVYFRADDDYRLYASNERCDSQPLLVQAVPVLTSGPARVRKGSVVPLTVRATPGIGLAIAFRRSGQTMFTLRRTGTANSSGYYSTSYRADADYEYYAVERPGQRGASRITRAVSQP